MSMNATFDIVLVHKNDMNILDVIKWVKVSVCLFLVCLLGEVLQQFSDDVH